MEYLRLSCLNLVAIRNLGYHVAMFSPNLISANQCYSVELTLITPNSLSETKGELLCACHIYSICRDKYNENYMGARSERDQLYLFGLIITYMMHTALGITRVISSFDRHHEAVAKDYF